MTDILIPSEKISESKQQLQFLLENILSGFIYCKIITDKEDNPIDFIFIETNKAFENITGIKQDTIIGKKITAILPSIKTMPFDWIGTFGDVALSGKPVRFEQYFPPLKCWYFISAYCPKPGFFAITFDDITKQKHAYEALNQNEKRLKLALESVSDAVWDWKIETNEVYFSTGWFTMLGYEPQELPHTPETLAALLHPDDITHAKEALIRHLKDDHPFEVEFRLQCKNKQWRWILGRGKVVERDSRGRAMRMLGTYVDIHSRKELEDRIQQAQHLESIGTLAGGIAHDFNNILYPIIGFTEIMLENAPQGSQLEENLNEVLTASIRAKELVEQLLTFSRQTEGQTKPLKVSLVIKEVVKLVISSLPSTITIKHFIDNDCSKVMADPTHIHQIAMNLITNAYHAMEEEGGTLTITLSETILTSSENSGSNLCPGRYVVLAVSDTGYGIPRQFLDRIFTPYFTTKQEGKGTGLGLSIIHGIVKSYKGDIQVSSEPGKGSIFTVYLPATNENKEVTGIATGLHAVPGGTEHILLVDDEERILKLLKKILENSGYRVTGLLDGKEALNVFRVHPENFDLIITDLTMPRITGEKLSFAAKQIRKDIPVILCTGFSDKMTQEKATTLGIEGFLLKPIIKADLAKTVRSVLDKQKQQTV